MKPIHRKVLKQALDLPPPARAALAGHLLDCLDDAVDEDAVAGWSNEIPRRIADLDRGKVKTVPWPMVRRSERGFGIGRKR